MSAKVINIKEQLKNEIFNLNKSIDYSKPNETSLDKIKTNDFNPEFKEKKLYSVKLKTDMKQIFDL